MNRTRDNELIKHKLGQCIIYFFDFISKVQNMLVEVQFKGTISAYAALSIFLMKIHRWLFYTRQNEKP